MAIVKPRMMRISNTPGNQRFYDLEEDRNRAIRACAAEWIEVMKRSNQPITQLNTPFFPMEDVAIPQALFDALEAHSPVAALTAASAFLEHYLGLNDEFAKPHEKIGDGVHLRQMMSVLMSLAELDGNFRPCWCKNFGQPGHDEHSPACSEAQELYDTFIKDAPSTMWPERKKRR
jgi:hypothetical protein